MILLAKLFVGDNILLVINIRLNRILLSKELRIKKLIIKLRIFFIIESLYKIIYKETIFFFALI